MTAPSAHVVADSVSAVTGQRLTTIEVTLHRFVLAELNTHRAFSSNSASSRAIPVEKQLGRIIESPAWPLEWPSERPGMQGGDFLEGQELLDADHLFAEAHHFVTGLVSRYLDDHPEKGTRLHKSLVNRLLEPFMWHTVIISSTEWRNFFDQRCSPLAQPEIRVPAELIADAYNTSVPQVLERGEWHTPYIQDDEYDLFEVPFRCMISAARCARVSYLTHDGVRDAWKDVELYDRLMSAVPKHWSPTEHVATPAKPTRFWRKAPLGNFDDWHQLRHLGLPS